jgi:hypothetical protein
MADDPAVDRTLVERYLKKAESEGASFLHDVAQLKGASYAGASAAARMALAILAERPEELARLTSISPVRSKPRLRVWNMVGRSYALCVANLPEFIRISWLWLLLTMPVFAIFSWWHVPRLITILQNASARQPEANSGLSLAVGSLGRIIVLPMAASIAVAWHRLILRAEHVRGWYLRFDRTVVSYAILSFLIVTLPNLLVSTFGALAQTTNETRPGIAVTVLTFTGLACWFIAPRLLMVLPARAVGRNDLTFGEAWGATRHNTWRLLWGCVLCLLPASVFGAALLTYLGRGSISPPVATVVWTMASLLGVFLSIVVVGFLSLAYRHFFEPDPAAL